MSIPEWKHAAQGVIPHDVVVKQRRGGMQADEPVSHYARGFMYFLRDFRKVLVLTHERRQLQPEEWEPVRPPR